MSLIESFVGTLFSGAEEKEVSPIFAPLRECAYGWLTLSLVSDSLPVYLKGTWLYNSCSRVYITAKIKGLF